MDGRYAAAYDLGSFASYTNQGSNKSQSVSTNGYVSTNSLPCFEDYDPTVTQHGQGQATVRAFNSTNSRILAPYQVFRPASSSQVGRAHRPSSSVDNDRLSLANNSTQRHMGMLNPLVSGGNTASGSTSPLQFANIFEESFLDSQPRCSSSFVGAVIDLPVVSSAAVGSSVADDSSSADSDGRHQQENKVFRLETLRLSVPGLSLEPIPASDVLARVKEKTDNVLTRYLPCVDFLVACQQELRAGLAIATQKRYSGGIFSDAMSPAQFFRRYISPLPDRFFRKNNMLMDPVALSEAVKGIRKLCEEARAMEIRGSESMKNTFLGGMKDGESWGLRKWLSKNGGALYICNDIECILHACQKLERSLESTRLLSERLRPLAQQTLDRLKNDVPQSYQEISTAHPYLPFFHRLESALIGMAGFDPDDDDVICIDDDDEIEAEKAKGSKRKACDDDAPSSKRQRSDDGMSSIDAGEIDNLVAEANPGDSDDDIIEIVGLKRPAKSTGESEYSTCPSCSMPFIGRCLMCSGLSPSPNEETSDIEDFAAKIEAGDWDSFFETKKPARRSGQISSRNTRTVPPTLGDQKTTAHVMAHHLDLLADIFDEDQQNTVRPGTVVPGSFWDGERYAGALRLFGSILRTPESPNYLERVDEQLLEDEGRPCYSKVIRHPLCFRDIVVALLDDDFAGSADDYETHGSDGLLPVHGLGYWNMWRGSELLQAIDLVFLNALAYGKASAEGKSQQRSETNRLRKVLWTGIHDIINTHVGFDSAKRREYTPTRRGESSGFVIRKESRR